MKLKEILIEITELLRGIQSNTSQTFQPQNQENEIIKEVEVVKEKPDSFSQMLTATGIRNFQADFLQDDELIKQFLGTIQENEAQQLIRLIATISQWNNIEAMWDIFAARCKQEQRVATEQESSILQQSIDLHNLIYQNRAAELSKPEIGSKYDYNKQTQGNTKGDRIAEVWLPELKNSGGEVRKKALVKTY